MGSAVYLLSLNEGPDIALDKPIVLFGRHPECDVLLNSRKISRKHCCIALVNGGLLIRDLGSTNGVKINGAPVDGGTLNVGDEVVIGIFPYRVTLVPDEKPAVDPTPPEADPTFDQRILP